MKEELAREYEAYESYAGKLAKEMLSREIEPKEPNVFKKAMLWGSIKMNTLKDDSKSHVAEMMIKGSVTGYCELIRLINGNLICNENVLTFAKKLVALEEGYVENLKKFL